MLKVNVEPIAPRLLNNRTVYSGYLRLTQEQAAILKEVVKQGKSQNPLNNSLDHACCLNCSLVFGLWLLQAYDRRSLSAHQFVNKFLGTVKFENDHVFCDSNLKVAFRQHTCYIHNIEGVDLLTGSQGNNLYTLSLGDMMVSSPICLLSKASKTKSWLWHGHLSHLNFDFDELSAMASEHISSEPALHEMNPATISSGLVPNPPPSKPFVPPSRTNWDLLFQPLFDELLTPPPRVDHPTPKFIASIADVVAPEPAASTGSPSSTTVDQDAPSPSNSQTSPEIQTPVISNDVEEDNHDLDVAHMNNDPFYGVEESPKTPTFRDDPLHKSLHEDSTSQGSSSNMRQPHSI
nr:hypothetical protein [Tanacetum cinerariifolium]